MLIHRSTKLSQPASQPLLGTGTYHRCTIMLVVVVVRTIATKGANENASAKQNLSKVILPRYVLTILQATSVDTRVNTLRGGERKFSTHLLKSWGPGQFQVRHSRLDGSLFD